MGDKSKLFSGLVLAGTLTAGAAGAQASPPSPKAAAAEEAQASAPKPASPKTVIHWVGKEANGALLVMAVDPAHNVNDHIRVYRGQPGALRELKITNSLGYGRNGDFDIETLEGRLRHKALDAAMTWNDKELAPLARDSVPLKDIVSAPAGGKPLSAADQLRIKTAAVIDRTLGPAATQGLLYNINVTDRNFAVSPISDKNTGALLGVEIMVDDVSKQPGMRYSHVTRDAAGGVHEKRAGHETLKIFINAGNATMVLDEGLPAGFVDAQGRSLTKPVPPDVVTVYDAASPPEKTTVLLLGDTGSRGGFAIRALTADSAHEINVSGDTRVDLSGASIAPDARTKFSVAKGANAAFTTPAGWGPPQTTATGATYRFPGGGAMNVTLEDPTSRATFSAAAPPAPAAPKPGGGM